MLINLGSKVQIIRNDIDNFYSEGETGTVVSLTDDSDVPEVEVEFDDASYSGKPAQANSTWWVLVDDLKVI